MSDIRCVVCGEPWDAYGVRHGDMLPWEATLFRAGAGCPSCEGTPNGWKPEGIFDLANGDEDEMVRLIAAERVADGTAPKWERPADPVHWTCDGCGVEVITDLDVCDPSEALEYRVPFKSKAHGWYSSHPFNRHGDPEKTPAHTFEHGAKVCEFCLEHCTECGCALSSHLELEQYDDGNSLQSPADPYHSVVCEDCLSKVEDDKAQRVWSDCYSTSKRIEYMRSNPNQFYCLYKCNKVPGIDSDTSEDRAYQEKEIDRWRDILANARGRHFSGCASELLY